MQYEMAMVFCITGLAYWKKESFLYVIAVLTMILVGWQWLGTYGLGFAAPMMLLAVYTVWKAVSKWLGR